MNGIIIQKGTPALRDKFTVSKKVRSMKAPATEIEPYFNAKKGLPSLRQHISGDDFKIHDDDFLQIPGRYVEYFRLILVALFLDGQDSIQS